MSNDWWSRRLSNNPQPASSQPKSTPPVSAPMRFPVQVPTQPQAQPQVAGQQRVLDSTKAPTEQISMGDAIRLWQGGEAMRREGDMTCPDCGSRNVFGRSSRATNTSVSGKAPAPRCFECGWNGMYNQAIEGSWGT
jgi:predicted nucleic-acid-binding Zn-ribbon protein